MKFISFSQKKFTILTWIFPFINRISLLIFMFTKINYITLIGTFLHRDQEPLITELQNEEMFVNYVKLLRLGIASVKQWLHKIIFSLRPIKEKKSPNTRPAAMFSTKQICESDERNITRQQTNTFFLFTLAIQSLAKHSSAKETSARLLAA